MLWLVWEAAKNRLWSWALCLWVFLWEVTYIPQVALLLYKHIDLYKYRLSDFFPPFCVHTVMLEDVFSLIYG